ncbi:hydroxypyruvate isomerase family protein [Croceivirga sp. JEA036]|uniref:hydroxypyruvate isomerase family protein n=1 Tax=Croceivirga sp. JEA036 TaxID=2721162 RepID=UPI00143C7162|nr:TIM barrel protein [Croceivirga sp. JEA036]NJB34968.1 TIM barrel protein [Croceivirga sp. JEA036]
MKRRNFITTAAAASAGVATTNLAAQTMTQEKDFKLKNNINHSVAQWCFNMYPLEEFLAILRDLGVKGIDLIGPDNFDLLKKYDIHCAMCNGAELGLTDGFNDPKNHAQLIKNYTEVIPKVADAGYTNLICFSGNRRGMNDIVGLHNCYEGLSKLMPIAEKYGVVIQMELFNQINHPDYMCDSSLWGVELCRRLGSDNFKLLYDIYHMQIQEGDIINTIQQYHEYFGHYHTAGVPGRHEIDESQELYYPAIIKAIKDTGFTGYVAQEFVVTWDDEIAALKDALLRCDV